MRLLPTKALFALISLASIALMVAACGGDPDSDTEPTATSTGGGADPTSTAQAATPTQTSADSAPAPRNDPGTITMVVPMVGKGSGTNGTQANLWQMGVSEGPFMLEKPKQVTGMVVEDWEVSPDTTKITLQIRQGIQFHGDWGELTAEDVAWNINDTNSATNPDSIHVAAGDYAAMLGDNPAVAVDEYTVELTVENFDVRWSANQFNVASQTAQMFSKQACDENGREWCQRNIIATGPWEVEEFRDDDRVVLNAVDEHWRQVPEFDRFILLEMPQDSARKAAMLTGEADIAEVSLRTQSELEPEGMRIEWTNAAIAASVTYGGNYWETTNALDDSPLEPWNTSPFDVDRPWTGAPSEWNDDLRYEDTDNPEGMDDMEQARLVRWALSMAFDRDLMNQAIFNGLAPANYLGIIQSTDENFQEKWTVPYDVETAKEYLDNAGFPEVNGKRFEVTLAAREDRDDFSGMADAIGGFWDEIGVETTVNKVTYSVFRPDLVARTNHYVYVSGCRHTRSLPWDWPRGLENTSMTRGGFNCAKEIPFNTDAFKRANAEPDMQKRIEINNELADYYHEQMLETGTVVQQSNVVFNPRSVESWTMRDVVGGSWAAPELIVPVSR